MGPDLLNKLFFLKDSFLREVSFRSGRLLNKPTFVSLEVSELCCLRCQQCDLWRNKKVHASYIQTRGRHNWKHGYFECRLKFQKNQGHHGQSAVIRARDF